MNKEVIDRETSEWSQYFKKPEMLRSRPNWWHPGGDKVSILSSSQNSLNLTSRYVKLSLIKEYEGKGLIIDWHLQSLLDGHAMVKHHYQGKMNFDLATASAAFGITDLCHLSSFWMVDLYGATAARQGFFIRYQDYLSLPGPGTGRDGDSNLSIMLDQEIQDWILKLLPSSDESRQIRLLPR